MKGIVSTGKKKTMKILSVFMVAVLICLLLSDGVGQVNAAGKKKVKSITISKPITSTLTLKKGGTYQFKVNILPRNASNKKLTYQSNKKRTVSVSAKGRLTAKKTGKAVISVRAKDGSKKSASVTVTVVKKLIKVSKVTLNKKSATLYLDGTKDEGTLTLKSTLTPKNASTKQVSYVSSKPNIANVNKHGVVTAKKEGSTVITVYAADGWGKKASCTIKVEKKNTPATPTATATATATVQPTPEPTPEPTLTVAANGKAMSIYLDADANDYEGLNLISESFARDVDLVNGTTPEIKTDLDNLEKNIIVAGSIGNNKLIDKWIQENKIQVSDIIDKWETFKIITLANPEPGVENAIVIVGSDKRGTIYGIYHISEIMGVSPWVYWGDVMPQEKSVVSFRLSQLNYTSKEPSVKYRGIFLNDEAPCLTSWITNTFKSPSNKGQEDFYEKVYELILRCKGNYLWPAMWSYNFSEDGKSKPIANAELANTYGIVMGTSHHEPLMRAGVEWGRVGSRYGGGPWNYSTNATALKKFWNDALKRNGNFENLITIGIRGENDSEIMPNGTLRENVELLKDVITAQRELLADNNMEDRPTILMPYKEVERYFQGGINKDNTYVEGLRSWDGIDDAIIMLTEDNAGNLRSLPTEENRDREKGWGMYYHFDYNGGPTTYMWINMTPLEKTWEQMSMAYDYGVDQAWIVNVGDLKPMEVSISYFLDMAYDFDKWGTNGINKTDDYLKQWVRQQFGEAVDEKGIDDLSSLIRDYLQINGNRKPESFLKETDTGTHSLINDNEAQDLLQKTKDIIELADEYKDKLPEKFQAPFYQLVYYPAVATATVNQIWIYYKLNELYVKQGRTSANIYAALVEEKINEDKELQRIYNKDMPGVGNKWDGMMNASQSHMCYTSWNHETGSYPTPKYVDPKDGSIMLVAPKGTDATYGSGSGSLPDFTNLNQEHHYIDIANSGDTPFTYTANASADWIRLTKTSGTVNAQDTVGVSIDWSMITENQTGTVTVTGAGSTVTININVVYSDVSQLDNMTFVETHNVVSIDANHFSNKEKGADGAEWKVIDNYGRTDSSLKTFPTTRVFPLDESPYLEYKVYVNKAGTYNLRSYTAPSNNVDWDRISLKYGVGVGDADPVEVETLSKGFKAGEYSGTWPKDVTLNIRMTTSTIQLEQGLNTIRFYTVDAPLVLQKLVLYRSENGLKSTYLGPKESYYKGKNIESKLVVDVQEDEIIQPE